MAYEKSEALKKARYDLIHQVFNKIKDVTSLDELYTTTYTTLAHVWLHHKAEEHGLLDKEMWSTLSSREVILDKIWAFLEENIR